MDILEQEISRAKRHETSLTVLMYDIDHFKKVNDTYGHYVGDNVLVSLTELVKNTFRDIDFMGRYGGEEFIVVMPNTTIENAEQISQRVRRKVQEYDFTTVGKLTISLGLVKLESDESAATLFKRLDDMLYFSKDSGRNRLSF